MLLQQSIEHVSIVYTCNTYFVMHWSITIHVIYSGVSGQCYISYYVVSWHILDCDTTGNYQIHWFSFPESWRTVETTIIKWRRREWDLSVSNNRCCNFTTNVNKDWSVRQNVAIAIMDTYWADSKHYRINLNNS